MKLPCGVLYQILKKSSNFRNHFKFENIDDEVCTFYYSDLVIILSSLVNDELMVGCDENQIVNVYNQLNEKFEIICNSAPDYKCSLHIFVFKSVMMVNVLR